MATHLHDCDTLMLAAQTEDQAAISRLLAVCQADPRRYAHKHSLHRAFEALTIAEIAACETAKKSSS
ncbi:hypothetical protein SAMN03159494_01688 [Achromobacter sp. NFACC18-2]|nr:hypothetical protein SAMN03159494_01688 [Achromobacter sp. NFACC18-2]